MKRLFLILFVLLTIPVSVGGNRLQTNNSINRPLELAITYSYDTYGRVTTEATPFGAITYTYTSTSAGEQIKVADKTRGATFTSTRTFDLAGMLKKIEDLGGETITYTYGASGNPVKIQTGTAVSEITYDVMGRRTRLKDPNAGTINYTYNAWGDLLTKTDARGQTETYAYHPDGRINTYKRGTEVFTYQYATEASKPKEQVIKVYNAAGMATEYGYDAVGRNTKITEKIDAGKSIILEYKYNAKNQVEQFIYPGGKALKYEYAYGDLKKMTWAPTGTVVWEKLSDNAKGQVLSAKAGNGLQTNYQYTAAGTPTSIKAMNGSAAMLNISYPSVDSRGNISQRKDEYKGLSETFIHDNLNRLSSNQAVVSYATNGNITSKVGVGNYTYNSSKPHAVSRLENISDGSLMTDNLTITYNPINRPLEVAISSTHKYTLTYGTNNQRVKSVYVKPGATTQTKYYAGPYEEIVRSGTQKNYYIYAGGEIVAVYTEGNPELSAGLYYFHNDHLGSPWLITNAAKGEVQRLSYDAWGRRRDPSDWNKYSNLPAMKFDRGYTGHEHLDMFGLINMNARMYNPALGRFLSADPFVQAPDFSQTYNRYSYCLNNPLKYTDPSGEYFGIDDLIAAAIGGTINLVVNAVQGNLSGHGLWEGIGRGAAAFGAGAAGGWGALYPEFGGWAWGGAAVGATNSWLGGAKGWDIAIGAGVGAVSGVAGGAAGQWGGKYLGDVIINGTKITSPVLQGAVSGAAGGAAGGYAGGFTAGLIMTGDFVEANSAGWKGAAFGAPIGGISGAASAYKYANDKGINPWTGKEKKQSSISQQNTLPYTDQQMGHKFGEHRDANLEGYRTISEYRQLANDIYNDPISIKTTFPLNSPMYGGETHYYWNGNLLRLDANGYFRSLYPH